MKRRPIRTGRRGTQAKLLGGQILRPDARYMAQAFIGVNLLPSHRRQLGRVDRSRSSGLAQPKADGRGVVIPKVPAAKL